MRSQAWRVLAVAIIGLFASVDAQTGTAKDLGSLLAGQKNLTTFYSLIQKYPQILLQLPSYSGVTILAPNNDAFEKIPYTQLNEAFADNDQDAVVNVLEYHILQGTKMAAQLVPGTPVFTPTLLTSATWTNVSGGQNVENVKQAGDVVIFVSGQGSRATLTQADLPFTGGVVQVIDSLLIPPTNLTSTTTSFNITSFQGALYQTSQLRNFTDTPNYTIFAPANSAFQALGSAISNLTVEDLRSVMDFHVLQNQVTFSTALENGTTWPTKQGENLTVHRSGNNVYIGIAQLLTFDILLANGVLHVIDNVLNPQRPGALPNPDLPTQLPAFAAASSVDSLPFTTAIPCTERCPAAVSTSGSASGVTDATRTATTSASSSVRTSSSKALGAAVVRETGFAAAGKAALVVALGRAVMML